MIPFFDISQYSCVSSLTKCKFIQVEEKQPLKIHNLHLFTKVVFLQETKTLVIEENKNVLKHVICNLINLPFIILVQNIKKKMNYEVTMSHCHINFPSPSV